MTSKDRSQDTIAWWDIDGAPRDGRPVLCDAAGWELTQHCWFSANEGRWRFVDDGDVADPQPEVWLPPEDEQ